MAAWLWVANADRWKAERGISAYEALRNYLETRDVSWSTPRFQKAIEAGDAAYIWLSGAGMVAAGEVREAPHRPPKVPGTPGWDEKKATSEWKTRISLRAVFFDRPVRVPGLQAFDVQNTVYSVDDQDHAKVLAKLQKGR